MTRLARCRVIRPASIVTSSRRINNLTDHPIRPRRVHRAWFTMIREVLLHEIRRPSDLWPMKPQCLNTATPEHWVLVEELCERDYWCWQLQQGCEVGR